jgi:hypothetical protein
LSPLRDLIKEDSHMASGKELKLRVKESLIVSLKSCFSRTEKKEARELW